MPSPHETLFLHASQVGVLFPPDPALRMMEEWLLSVRPRYLSLYTEIGAGGAGAVEVSGPGYDRAQVFFGREDEEVVSLYDVFFPQALGEWGVITHYGIGRHRKPGHGQLYFYGKLPHPLEFTSNGYPKVTRSGATFAPTAWFEARIEKELRKR